MRKILDFSCETQIIECNKIFLFLCKLDYSFNQTPVPNHMEHGIKIVSLYHETGHDNFF